MKIPVKHTLEVTRLKTLITMLPPPTLTTTRASATQQTGWEVGDSGISTKKISDSEEERLENENEESRQ